MKGEVIPCGGKVEGLDVWQDAAGGCKIIRDDFECHVRAFFSHLFNGILEIGRTQKKFRGAGVFPAPDIDEAKVFLRQNGTGGFLKIKAGS